MGKSIKVVVGLALNNDGEILIAKRPNNKALAGKWEFPGGKIEEGESHSDALKREFFEEMGIEIDSIHPMGKYCHSYSFGEFDLFVYFCRIIKSRPIALEHQELCWSSIEKLITFDLVDADKKIIVDLLKSKK